MYRKGLFCTLIMLGAVACTPSEEVQQKIQPIATEHALEAHLEFLAHDLLEGRDTGARGHDIASAYIVSQFKQLGLEPAGDDGYYQNITFRVAHLVEGSAQLTLHDGNRDIPLTFLQDFTTSPSTLAQQLEVRAPLVFVGYGLVSERFGFDDYANHDVTDSIVVTISGLPEGLPSEEAAHLGRIKTELAIERGAIGVITIHTPEREAVRPFDTIRKYAKSARRMTWLSPEGRPNSTHQKLLGSAYLHYEAAEQLFEHVGFSLDDVWQQIADNKMPPSAELGLSATLSKASVFEEVQSANVIAKLPGTNPVLRDEVVLYTAHSDHLGLVNNSGNPAKVYNGALDNAAGVAVMLETARMFVDAAKQGDTLDRTVMFAAVTAEERGLLGADYFAHFPTTPIENIVANVNLDMPVLLYNFADVVAFGAEHSSLGDVVATAAEQYGISRSPDPMPEQAIFTRSDHYALVKKGIPAVFLMTGFQSQHDDEDGGQVWADFFAEHYHQHSDEISTLSEQYGGIRYDAGVVFSQINYEIGYLIGTAPKRPEWLPESYFGQVFGGHRATPMEQESHE